MIFFVNDEQLINDRLKDLDSDKTTELLCYSRTCKNYNIPVFWTCLDMVDLKRKEINLIDIKTQDKVAYSISELYEKIPYPVIFKFLGSVEKNREKIEDVIDVFKRDFKGLCINDLDTMRYFFDKKYLLELQENGFNVPKLSIEKRDITYKELSERYDVKTHIIKPLSGELSNSFARLSNVDDDWLTHKKENTKVTDWIIQKFSDKVWRGEYQLVFLGNDISHCLHKQYSNEDDTPKQNTRKFDLFEPSENEIFTALKVKEFVENKLNKKVDYFRFDYFKDDKGNIDILEFECVNPGFFFGYIQDEEVKEDIAVSVINFLLKKNNEFSNRFVLDDKGAEFNHNFLFNLSKTSNKLTISNASQSRFSNGWNDYLPFVSKNRKDWSRVKKSNYTNGELSFSFEADNKYACCYPPINLDYLNNLPVDVQKTSNNIPYVKLNNNIDKDFLVVLARQHPGESIAGFFAKGVVEQAIKENVNLLIFPLVNVSGNINGNHRLTSKGLDLNRLWNTDITEIKEIKDVISSVGGISALIDVHGDEASKINYAYQSNDSQDNSKLLGRDFVVLPNQHYIKKFIKNFVKNGKFLKPNSGLTAKDYYGKKGVNALTVELSFHKNTPEKAIVLGRKIVENSKNTLSI